LTSPQSIVEWREFYFKWTSKAKHAYFNELSQAETLQNSHIANTIYEMRKDLNSLSRLLEK